MADKYIYKLSLPISTFDTSKSIQLTLLDMIGSFIVFLTIVNCVNWLRCLDTIDNKPKRGNNMAFAPVETSFKDNFQNPFRFPFVFKSYIC